MDDVATSMDSALREFTKFTSKLASESGKQVLLGHICRAGVLFLGFFNFESLVGLPYGFYFAMHSANQL